MRSLGKAMQINAISRPEFHVVHDLHRNFPNTRPRTSTGCPSVHLDPSSLGTGGVPQPHKN